MVYTKTLKYHPCSAYIRQSAIEYLRNLPARQDESRDDFSRLVKQVARIMNLGDHNRKPLSVRKYGQESQMLFVLPNDMGRRFARDDLTENATI